MSARVSAFELEVLRSAFETIADEGFLNNPYRSVRYLDVENPAGFAFQPEVYPTTRTSNGLIWRLHQSSAPPVAAAPSRSADRLQAPPRNQRVPAPCRPSPPAPRSNWC